MSNVTAFVTSSIPMSWLWSVSVIKLICEVRWFEFLTTYLKTKVIFYVTEWPWVVLQKALPDSVLHIHTFYSVFKLDGEPGVWERGSPKEYVPGDLCWSLVFNITRKSKHNEDGKLWKNFDKRDTLYKQMEWVQDIPSYYTFLKAMQG